MWPFDKPARRESRPRSFKARIAAERSRIHARMARMAAPGQLAFALVAALALVEHLPRRELAVVLGLLAVLSFATWLIASHLIRMKPDDARLAKARLGIVLVAVAASLLAGSSVAMVLHQLPESTRLVLTVVLLATYAVSVAAHHANPVTLLAVGIAMLGPVAVAGLFERSVGEAVMAFLLVGLVLMAWVISLIAGGAIDDAIRARLRIDDLTLRLKARSRDLEAAVRAKTQFLAAVSHDLRQPVTSLNLLLGGLSEQSAAVDGGEDGQGVRESRRDVAALAARMQPAVRAMGNVLDSMLEMSRLEAGLVKMALRSVDLRDLLLSIQIEYTPQAQANQLQLTSDVPAISIETDRDLLGRIVRNLVDNALKYTPSGSVWITARTENAACVIAVRDTGLGITKELQERIFDDYFQAGNPNRDRGMGLGLGLSIVKRLVALLGGTITLDSRQGAGSTFELRLPVTPVQSLAPAEPVLDLTLAAALAGKSRLLLVDDDPLIRDAFSAVLEGVGIESRIATNPHEALALVQKTGFAVDVAIVDYRLPGGLSGLQVLEVLMAGKPTLAGVLITGDLDPGLIGRAADFGVAIVNKPFTAGQLALGIAGARQLAAARTIERRA